MKVLFTTLVMLYLVVDFGDPNLPGAITFDPDGCVEVVQAHRAPAPAPRAVAVMPAPVVRLAVAPRVPGRVVRSMNGSSARVHAVRHLQPDVSASEEG